MIKPKIRRLAMKHLIFFFLIKAQGLQLEAIFRGNHEDSRSTRFWLGDQGLKGLMQALNRVKRINCVRINHIPINLKH